VNVEHSIPPFFNKSRIKDPHKSSKRDELNVVLCKKFLGFRREETAV